VRWLYVRQASALPLFQALIVDARAYWDWSDRIAGGDWLGDAIFYQAPLYPYFLALLKAAFGADLAGVRLVQNALGALACGVLFLAGRRLLGWRAGIAAGLLLALYPPAIFFDSLIQKANLGLVWVTLLLWALAGAQAAAGAWRLGVCGGLLGLLMLTREESLLLVPVLALWILLGPLARPLRERALGLGAFALGLALVLAPVAWRNHVVGGELVLTTAQAGPNFYIGNGPEATGIYVPLLPGRGETSFERRDAEALAEAALWRELTPREVSRHWFDAAFDHIRARPGRWLRLLVVKARLLVNWYEIPDAEDLYFFERSSLVLRTLGGVLHLGVLVPLAAAGAVLTLARWRELLVLHLFLLTLAGGVIAFYVMARYRYPLVPGLALLAGAGLVEAFERVRARRWSALLAAVAAAAAFGWLCNDDIFERDVNLVQSRINSAIALEQLGRPAEAVEEFREALRLAPGLADTWAALGDALAAQQRQDEALVAYEQASRLRPRSWRHAARLGSLRLERREFQRAHEALSRATAQPGAGAEAWQGLAAASEATGSFAQALEAWRRAHELAPTDYAARLGLARLLATCPDTALRDGAEALALAQALVQERPDDPDARAALAAAEAARGRGAPLRP
jgi:tetratricopeptide (TPR) repeat protein